MKTLSAFGGDHDPNYFNRELSHGERPGYATEEFELFSSGLDEVREVESPAAREVRAQLRWVRRLMCAIAIVCIAASLWSKVMS